MKSVLKHIFIASKLFERPTNELVKRSFFECF